MRRRSTVTLAIGLLAIGALTSGHAATAQIAKLDEFSAKKKCKYGSYVDRKGKRRCFRAPRGSNSGQG